MPEHQEKKRKAKEIVEESPERTDAWMISDHEWKTDKSLTEEMKIDWLKMVCRRPGADGKVDSRYHALTRDQRELRDEKGLDEVAKWQAEQEKKAKKAREASREAHEAHPNTRIERWQPNIRPGSPEPPSSPSQEGSPLPEHDNKKQKT